MGSRAAASGDAAVDIAAIADALLAAFDGGTQLAPITESMPDFDVPRAYDVLHEIERRRVARGWRPVGRKIGFTNRTLWPRYGVYQPMWAHTWRETVIHAHDGAATVSLARMVEPRIEPEVVFGLRGPGAHHRRRARRAARGGVDRAGIRDRAIALPRMEVQGGGLHGGVRPARRAGRRHARAA